MDLKQIQELVKLVNKSNIGTLSIEKDDFKIIIKQKKEPSQNYVQASPNAQYTTQPSLPSSTAPSVSTETSKSSDTSSQENLLTIKSPMIGTFYRQSSPGKPIFVNVGDDVTTGTVVCIIEAMKLFNEIESEVTGKIVKVLVEDASPVEFDQPLFLVEPV